jgi:hypothetical protein
MIDRELKHVTSIHTTHDVREYYVCYDREIVMEKVCKEGDKCSYYTYTLVEFIAGTKFEDVKKALKQKSPL